MPHSFWPPLRCTRQAGRKNQYLGVIAWYSPKGFFGASTEIGHLGAERPGAYPVALVRHPPGSAGVQTQVELVHHFCSLLIGPQDQHTHTHA